MALAATLATVALGVPAAEAQTGPVAVYPIAASQYNLPGTQIVFRGIAPREIGAVHVTGSKSGTHTGHLAADSDGQGASFLPDHPFTAGETVTVSAPALTLVGGKGGTYSFAIARPAGAIPIEALPLAPAGSRGVQHFPSRPDLQPAAVAVTQNSAPASAGDIFIAPQFGPTQDGPMIIDPHGNLVWFDPFPVARRTLITDFRVQSLHGQPVLTWWQGGTNAGYGLGQGIIMDRSYRQIAAVHAADGLSADLHEFLLTDAGDAYLFAASPVQVPGISHPVIDSVVQEIDVSTGLLLFEWHALDHVPTSQSYVAVPPTKGHPWDPYHANSIDPAPDGSLIVSMRNTSAIYRIDRSTGRVLWTLGGKQSSFKMGPGTRTYFQHDAELQPDGTLTVFDDGAGPPAEEEYSRALHEQLDTQHMTATRIASFAHSPQVSANFEGSAQLLPGGDIFVGWGQQPYFSEHDDAGHQDFDGHFVSPTSSYRAYRFPWSGQPADRPALAVHPASDGTTVLYASWNGATAVSSWSVLGGSSARSLTPLGSALTSGFETRIVTHSATPYYAVQALDAAGRPLATSPAVARAPHLAISGRSAFVSSHGGTGGLPVSCYAATTCRITTSIVSGRTVIARTGTEQLAAGTSGVVHFRLSSAGLRMLEHASGGRLPVRATVQSAGVQSAWVDLNLIAFSTAGAGPPRAASQSADLQVVGMTDFVSAGSVGGILASCRSQSPCHVSTTLSSGSTPIAQTGTELLGAGQLGYLFFKLTPAGQALMQQAPGNQLPTHVALSDGGSGASADIALVAFR